MQGFKLEGLVVWRWEQLRQKLSRDPLLLELLAHMSAAFPVPLARVQPSVSASAVLRGIRKAIVGVMDQGKVCSISCDILCLPL